MSRNRKFQGQVNFGRGWFAFDPEGPSDTPEEAVKAAERYAEHTGIFGCAGVTRANVTFRADPVEEKKSA